MEKNIGNDLTYWLSIDVEYLEYLGKIRNWDNLKIANTKGQYWVKDITLRQLKSIEIQTIPFKNIYYQLNNKLFPKDSKLPCMKMPSFLWTPIKRGLPVAKPKFNNNFFGISEKINVKLVPTELEQNSHGLLVTLNDLASYIFCASAVRLKNLQWVLIDKKLALILGIPILPISGKTYWLKDNLLIPTGYNFEFPFLSKHIQNIISIDSEHLIWWNKNSTCTILDKGLFQALSLSSFRLSISSNKIQIADGII